MPRASQCGTFALCLTLVSSPLWAYTPNSPEVQAMIGKGVAFLSIQNPQQMMGGRLGTHCLVAYSLVKANAEPDHFRIQDAIKACQLAAKDAQPGPSYDRSVAIIFLCDLDPKKYAYEIRALVDLLLRDQGQDGAWTYPGDQRGGDTSQSQFAVLALWYAQKQGFPVPTNKMEMVANWFLRNQDQTGCWYYMPKERKSPLTMTAAGAASLMILSDFFRFMKVDENQEHRAEEEEKLPPALKKVLDKAEKADKEARDKRPVPTSLNSAAVAGAIGKSAAFFNQGFKIEVNEHESYYLYVLERFQSFRELAEGSNRPDPPWYNAGVQLLSTKQLTNGAFEFKEEASATAEENTALSILFLLRSTKKAISKFSGEGTLAGGRGLPGNNTTNIRIKDGKVVAAPAFRSVDDMIKIMGEDSTDFDKVSEFPDDFKLNPDPATRNAQIMRLRRVVSSGNYQARRIAVKVLSRTGDMENVPTILYGLTDPDLEVMREARDGLCFMSRKFKGFGPSDEPSPEQRREAEAQWKKWFKTLRPDLPVD